DLIYMSVHHIVILALCSRVSCSVPCDSVPYALASTTTPSSPVLLPIQLRSYVPSPLSVIFRRRQLVPLIAACRTCRNTKLGGVNPELVVLATAATTFTMSPSRNRGTRLATSNSAAGSVTSTSSVSLRYTFTSVTVTVWRLASTTVQSCGESCTTHQPCC